MNPRQALVLVVLTVVTVGANASLGAGVSSAAKTSVAKTSSAVRPQVRTSVQGARQSSPQVVRQCSDLVAELRAMRAAQQTLLANMVGNNQTMATTLEDYSAHLKEASKTKRPVLVKEISSLHQSASAFRSHGIRESKLVSRFNRASEKLVARIEVCLK